MKEIKIIDLLNMITEGKKVPKTIIYRGSIYTLSNEQEDYFCSYKTIGLLDEIVLFSDLNETVKIIEEDIPQPEDVLSFTLTDKVWTPRQARELIENFRKISEKLKRKEDNNKIEKLELLKGKGPHRIKKLEKKVNEIIDKINNME